MSILINSNIATSKASLNLKKASERLSTSIQRLSSGKRIINASDDAGGLAVAMKLQSSLRRVSASMSNTQNGYSFLQMQDSVLKIAGEIVDRMAELKSFYNDISKNDLDRDTYNHEFHDLQKELKSLKAQKFNGVSLFSSSIKDNDGFKIVTSDDGKGEPIEVARTGLFENLKSKFGPDGELNSGSQGNYRQLVGEFVADGGMLDATPGFTSRAYKPGDVAFRRAATDAESGYFMALKDVVSGAKILDTQDVNSNWVRIANKHGEGFAESYPNAEKYSHTNLKFTSKGEPKAYLQNDILKVQAHWNDPNAFVYLKAISDVPRNITLERILNGMVSGEGKYFEFVGVDQTNDTTGKPTTDYVRPNSEHSTPLSMSNESPKNFELLRAAVTTNANSNFTPEYVQVDGAENSLPSIYTATKNWGIKEWSFDVFRYGDVVFDSDASDDSIIKSINKEVRGAYLGSSYEKGDYVLSNGNWFKALSDIVAEDAPSEPGAPLDHNPATIYNTGEQVVISNSDGFTALQATSKIKGEYSASTTSEYVVGDAIWSGNNWYKLDSLPLSRADFPKDDSLSEHTIDSQDFNTTDPTLVYDSVNDAYRMVSAVNVGGGQFLTFTDATIVDFETSDINGDMDNPVVGDFWTDITSSVSNWQVISDPMNDTGFATNVTDQYADLNNTDFWSKTHFGALVGKTIGTNYERGDNIFYQGKHYVYISSLPSNDPNYTTGSGESGVTHFEQLVTQGAVVELGVYVDTVGGGGSPGLHPGVYYSPNEDLEFMDRLSGTGQVRTNSIERRTDPSLNGDGIFNTQDDLFYGGLNSGNDGIYGTEDDYYSTTSFRELSQEGGHVDSDADNNKDLLNESNGLADFSVADFIDYIQTIANFRAINGGTMTRLDYANRLLEESQINLEAAHGRIMDADIAVEASRMAQQNVLLQAASAMVAQANQMNNVVLQLLQ